MSTQKAVEFLSGLADLLKENEEAMVVRSTVRAAIRSALSTLGGGSGSNSSLSLWDDTIHLLVTGQSNMLSRDDSDQATTSVSGVKIINSVAGSLETWDLMTNPPQHLIASPGVGSSGAEVAHDSLAFYFVKLLKESTGKNVVVIFAAWGGTALQFWLSPSGEMYAEIVDQIQTSTGIYVPRIDLHLHHQGENNDNDAGFAQDLLDFRSSMEGLAKYPATCPMIMGEVFRKTAYDDINEKLNTFASADADVYLATSDGLTSTGDEIHFNSASLLTLATRMRSFVAGEVIQKINANASGTTPTGTITDLSTSATGTTITITWSDVVDATVIAYIVEKLVSGTYREVGRVAPGVETFDDSGLLVETEYTHRVRGINAYGQVVSNTDTATTGGSGVTINESFNTADSDTLGPDLSWTETAGNLQIVSNRAVRNGAATNHFATANDAVADDNVYAEITVAAQTFQNVGVGVRCTTADQSGIYFIIGPNGTCGVYSRSSGGSWTAIETTTITFPSLPYTCRVQVSGTAVTGYVNDVEVVLGTSSNHDAQDKCGIHIGLSSDGGIDAFEAATL